MRCRLSAALILFLAIFKMPVSGYAEEIKVYLDESKKEFIMAKKMDCSVYRSKKGITIGFKAGNLLFGFGPELTFGGETEAKWGEAVQGIIARYQELCARFNAGLITKKEYDERIAAIDQLAKEAMEVQDKALKRVKDEADDTFTELDREVSKGHMLKKEINDLSVKINNIIMP